MTGTIRSLLTAIVLLSWATSSIAITPEQKARVRELVKDGGRLVDSGKPAEARDRFMAALELARVPAIALYVARTHENLRELLKAAQLYRLASEMQLDEALWDHDEKKTQFQLRSREEAKAALRQLLERNCTVRIQLVGSVGVDIRATIDGIELDRNSVAYELPVDPGSHVVVIVQGSTRHSQTVNVDQREHKTVTFDLTAAPTIESPEGQRFGGLAPLLPAQQGAQTTKPTDKTKSIRTTPRESTYGTRDYLKWVAYGIGAAGLGTGIVAGFVTLDKRSALISEGCTADGSCSRDSHLEPSKLESHNTWRTITTVGFVVGGVGAIAGVTLSLTQPKTERAPRLALHLAPGTIGARGTF